MLRVRRLKRSEMYACFTDGNGPLDLLPEITENGFSNFWGGMRRQKAPEFQDKTADAVK